MNKKKSTADFMKSMRNSWVINPRTRIQENEMKNNKKRRQMTQKIVKGGY